MRAIDDVLPTPRKLNQWLGKDPDVKHILWSWKTSLTQGRNTTKTWKGWQSLWKGWGQNTNMILFTGEPDNTTLISGQACWDHCWPHLQPESWWWCFQNCTITNWSQIRPDRKKFTWWNISMYMQLPELQKAVWVSETKQSTVSIVSKVVLISTSPPGGLEW